MPLDEEIWYTEANFNAAIFILKKKWGSKIKENIDFALQKNPKSIHAMCNKGLFYLAQRPPRLDEAKQAVKEIEELCKEDKPAKDAQLEQAYWRHTHKRSKESRKSGLQTFKELLPKVPPYNYTHHYYYMKMLRGEELEWNHEEERTRIAQCIVDQLTILKSSREQIYELEVWSVLAELQRHLNVWSGLKFTSLLGALEVESAASIDLVLCANKMIEILESGNQSKVYSNYYAKVGKAFLQHSHRLNEKDRRIEMLDKALTYCKKSQKIKASRIERAPNILAEVYMWKWAIQYYEENKDEVESYVERLDRPNKVFSYEGKARYWNYLVRCFYTLKPDDSSTTKPYLEEAKDVIRDALIPGRVFAPRFYPRILMLSGDSHENVERSFEHIWIRESYSQLRLGDKGLFYETIGEKEKAKDCYKAVTGSKESRAHFSYCIARNGLDRLKNC